MVFIYILRLEKGKYYVGKTNSPEFRIDKHFNSNGSTWTRLYKPIKVLELKPDCDDYDEDKITIQYMDKYGINNVRGGSFSSTDLDKSTRDILKKMIYGSNNKCFNCGEYDHFAKDCDECEEESEEESEEDDDCICLFCDKEFIDEDKCQYHERYCRYRSSHYK